MSRGGRGAGQWHGHFDHVSIWLAGGGPAVSEAAARGMLIAAGALLAASFDEARAELEAIGHPVLYANGLHGVMIPARNSYVAVQYLANATLVLYAGAGRAFLFQYAKACSSTPRHAPSRWPTSSPPARLVVSHDMRLGWQSVRPGDVASYVAATSRACLVGEGADFRRNRFAVAASPSSCAVHLLRSALEYGHNLIVGVMLKDSTERGSDSYGPSAIDRTGCSRSPETPRRRARS
jgi:hypothetical protein